LRARFTRSTSTCVVGVTRARSREVLLERSGGAEEHLALEAEDQRELARLVVGQPLGDAASSVSTNSVSSMRPRAAPRA
jgi:hypothetical protein